MSTPEQPASPALTRKQIRELRNTGSTPVITAAPTADAAQAPEATEPVAFVPPTPPPAAVVPVTAAPFPRPAEPADIPPAPVADSTVDLGVSPLTRRQARQQERIRTASVPVITPEVVAAHAAATGAPAFAFSPAPAPTPAPAARQPQFAEPQPAPEPEPAPSLFVESTDSGEVSTDSGVHALFGLPPETEPEPASDAVPVTAAPIIAAPVAAPTAPQVAWIQPIADDDARIDAFDSALAGVEDPIAEEQKAVVSPLFGAGLLESEAPVAEPASEPEAPEFPPSFDQLLSRSTGAIALPSALIVAQAPEVSSLVAPVTATGEVIVTGTFNLPEGLGSTGHAKGTTDGKEVDAILVDGELPVHSSPTPIAASAAVSTVKMPGEVIKPPAPEKGGKLMMSLAVTAGVLALALVGVLILAFATGVFS